METNFENKMKEIMHNELNELELPPSHLFNDARRIIESRRKTKQQHNPWWKGLLNLELSVYQVGFTAILIAVSIIFVSRQKYSGGGLYNLHTQTATTSISTSTSLAGLSQNPKTNHSVNSSTVLTSIITFVARN